MTEDVADAESAIKLALSRLAAGDHVVLHGFVTVEHATAEVRRWGFDGEVRHIGFKEHPPKRSGVGGLVSSMDPPSLTWRMGEIRRAHAADPENFPMPTLVVDVAGRHGPVMVATITDSGPTLVWSDPEHWMHKRYTHGFASAYEAFSL